MRGRATQVALGRRHTLVLLEDGRVQAFGDNRSGQLGLGHTRSPILVPTLGMRARCRACCERLCEAKQI